MGMKDDLPRIVSELAAMKVLSHQNICRLYQAIETDHKFYFVLEVRAYTFGRRGGESEQTLKHRER